MSAWCVCLTHRHGPFVNVLVGATIVGSMATVWHGVVNPPRLAASAPGPMRTRTITFAQGDEMGRFLLGSTVVMLWPRNTIRFNPQWAPARPIRLGEAMGQQP
jgi:phosphatidylserine decarboxylase